MYQANHVSLLLLDGSFFIYLITTSFVTVGMVRYAFVGTEWTL